MSTEFDEIGKSIVQEQKRIHENQTERTRKYQQCLDSYLKHLKHEISQLDKTEEQNDARNEMISSAFENVYERVMIASQVGVRKIKETCFEKKQFWEELIKNNAVMTDIEMKKHFYQEKRDAEDRYYDAIQNQKVKKLPYNLLLGKLKQKQDLRQWQDNNKKLEQKVTNGTKTMKEWHIGEKKNNQVSSNLNDSEYFIQQFTQPETGPWVRPPLHSSNYKDIEENSFLKNFEYRRD